MLYDPARFNSSGKNTFSNYISEARAHRSLEEVRSGLFGDGATTVPGHFFEALAGFHFGMCGPVSVPATIKTNFFCDIPLLVALLVLDGEGQFAFDDVDSPPATLRKNMFMVGHWDSLRGSSTTPAQESYCHVALSIERGTVAKLFGYKAEKDMQETLALALGSSHAVCGPASPDALASAKQILHMQKQGPLGTMALRGAVLEFFTCLLKNAAEQDTTPATPLHERDAFTLTALKERIEKDCAGLSAKELCASIGMSESKANKGFKTLFGTTIARHLHVCKMAHAHALLTRKKYTVSECAFALGYSNIGHFIAAFRKHYGTTPKEASRAT